MYKYLQIVSIMRFDMLNIILFDNKYKIINEWKKDDLYYFVEGLMSIFIYSHSIIFI